MPARTAVFETIAADLRRRIRSGELAPGDRLPGEDDLAGRYSVARGTMRKALGLLRSEGLITTFQGRRGSIVNDPRKAPQRFEASTVHARSRREATPDRDAFQSALTEAGRTGHMDISVDRVAPPEEIRARLGLDEGEDAIVRRRVQHVDGRPSAIADSWYRAEFVEGTDIASPDDVLRGTNRVLDEIGHGLVRSRHEIRGRMPTPVEAQVLQIAGGVPVLEAIHTEIDASGTPVEVYALVLPTDRHVLVCDVDLDV